MGRPRRPLVLACVTAASARGLDVLVEPSLRHLWVPEHAGGRAPQGARLHRSKPIAPATDGLESVADMLAHVTVCLPELEALVVWESALRKGLLSARELRRIRWRGPVPRRLAASASLESDSLLETIALHRLRALGLSIRQQVVLRGRPIDFLVGDRLVIQVDGFRFHTAAQRRRDIEHDAMLGLDGLVVLRFAYGDVVHKWERTESIIVRTLAQL